MDMQSAYQTVKDGGIVIFPTDTVYGIGCDPYNKNSVSLLYKIKKREKTKPFPVLGYSKKELEKIAVFNSLATKIAEKFWPGPLTMILSVKDADIQKSLGLENKIAVRVPDNTCILSLLKECKVLIGTSANISDETSLIDPNDCETKISNYDLLIDGGTITSKGESTIVEIDGDKVKIVREGSVPEKEIYELN